MLASNPEVTEQQAKGNTPREILADRNSQRVHQVREFLSTEVEALAYRHVTRMAGSGQRTGSGSYAQECVGVRA